MLYYKHRFLNFLTGFTTLRAKIILSFIALTLLLGMVTFWLVYSQISKNSRDTLIRKGKSITQAMIESSRHLVLTDNTIRLQELIDALKLSDDEISYIYIADYESKPLAHTFKQNVPDDLLNLTIPHSVSEFKYLYLKTDNDFIHHIIMPIDQGKVGFISLGLSDFYRRQRIGSLLRDMIVMALLCITFGIIGMYILSGIITASIRQLTNAAQQIGRGEFNVKVDVSTRDEMAELANAFNKMSLDLKEHIKRLNDTEDNLSRAQQMSAIGQMCAALAHEINNPLDGIQRSIAVIRNGSVDKGLNETLFNLASEGLKRIEHTVRQLLRYARYQPHFESIDINVIIDKVFQSLGPRIKEQGVEIETQLDRTLGLFKADPDGLFQVMANLLINALDILGEKGKISARTALCKDDKNSIEIIFADNGPGIPAEIGNKIFEPFFTTKDKSKGTGLGLSITKSIIERHNGSIRVESDVGQGTRFIILLPYGTTAMI